MKENLMFQNAPHVRQSESVVTIMSCVIFALLPIYLISFFYFGLRSLVLGLCGVVSCCLFSAIGFILLREKIVADFTPIITGLIIPLLMPADITHGYVTAHRILAEIKESITVSMRLPLEMTALSDRRIALAGVNVLDNYIVKPASAGTIVVV